ncbi:hypothetical protein QVD99_007595 [Batrachochytrium dendrobatidis]|nr:hypothetical protein QVD99_007595 [Batrachochytrium dendrobatidis]
MQEQPKESSKNVADLTLKLSKQLQLEFPLISFDYDGVVPFHFEAVSDRLSETSMLNMFEGELNHCIKSIKALALLYDINNSQLCLVRTQLQACFQKFKQHINPSVYISKCIVTGEILLQISKLHQIASKDCLEFSLVLLTAIRSTTSETASASIVFQCLKYRALFGILVAQFISVVDIDPGLKSCTSACKILDIILKFKSICKETQGNNDLSWCNWLGIYHISNLCKELSNSEWTEKILDHAKWITESLEEHSTSDAIHHISWKIESYNTLFKYYLKTNNTNQALLVINQAISKISGTVTENPTNSTQSNDWTFLNYLKLLRFTWHLNQLASTQMSDQDVQHNVDFHSAPKLDSFSVDVFTEKDLKAGLFELGRIQSFNLESTALPSDFYMNSKSKEFSNYASSQPNTSMHIFEYNSYVHRNRKSICNDPKISLARLFKLVDIEKQKCSTYNHCSFGLIEQLNNGFQIIHAGKRASDNEKLNDTPDENKSNGTSNNATHSLPADKFGKHKQINVSSTEGEPEILKFRKSASKKIRTIDNDDVVNPQVALLDSIKNMINSIPTDGLKLSVIIQSLIYLNVSKNTCYTEDHIKNKQTATNYSTSLLLGLAFSIVTFTTYKSTKSVQTGQDMDYWNEKFFELPDFPTLHQAHRAQDFHMDDIIQFISFLFESRQWERMNCIIKMVCPILEKNTRLQNIYGQDLILRSAISRYLTVLHSERKVMFQDETFNYTTKSNLLKSSLEKTRQFHFEVVNCFSIILACLEDRESQKQHANLLVKISTLLWLAVQPYVRELRTENDALHFKLLSRLDSLLVIIEFIHVFQSMVLITNYEEAAIISSKLGLLLEAIGSYKHAEYVFLGGVNSIDAARIQTGEGSNLIYSTTVDTSFHTGQSRYIEAEESKCNPFGLSENPQTLSLRKRLCDIQVGLLSCMYRCKIKYFQNQQSSCALENSMQKKSLLESKQTIISGFKTLSTTILTKACGHDHSRRAIYLLVLATTLSHISTYQKRELLVQAMENLKQAYLIESETLKCENASCSSKKDWSPVLVRKTPTSITISPNRPYPSSESGTVWIKIQASAAGQYLGKSSTEYPGSGELFAQIFNQQLEMTVSQLSPNTAYNISMTIYKKNQADSSFQITSRSIKVIASLPLPLLLCWTTLSEIAHTARYYDLADSAFEILSSHFLCSVSSDNTLCQLETPDNYGIYQNPSYELFEFSLRQSSSAVIRSYINCIFMNVDRHIDLSHHHLTANAFGKEITISHQIVRLRACRDLLLAVELAKHICDGQLQLLCAFKIYQNLWPFIQFDIKCAFVQHVLMNCHEILMANIPNAREDCTNVLEYFFVPVTHHLLNGLKNCANYPLIVKVVQESLQLVQLIEHAVETKISNSAAIEQAWLGHTFKPKRLGGNHTKSHYYSEFAFQGKVAVLKDNKKGVAQSRKKSEIFSEYLEVTLAQNSQLVSKLNQSQFNLHDSRVGPAYPENLSSKRPMILHRKSLDTHTCLKDIFILFATCGPEATMQELMRFKKNPRYIEIVSNIMQWCVEKELYDAAFRIGTEVEEWIDKRNQTIVLIDQLAENTESSKDVLIKRRRRHLFSIEKHAIYEIMVKNKSDSTGLQDHNTVSKEKHLKKKIGHQEHAVERVLPSLKNGAHEISINPSKQPNTSPARTTEPSDALNYALRSKSRIVPPTSAGTDSNESNPSALQNNESGSKTRPSSREARPTSKTNGGNARPSRSASNSRANSASPHGVVKEDVCKEEVDQTGLLALKRKRLQQRHTFFIGLSPSERERKDHAARVLDNCLGAWWHRRRYLQRLRAILEFESLYRSEIAFLRGKIGILQLQRDHTAFKANLHDLNDFFDSGWFEYRQSGCLLLNNFAIYRNEMIPIGSDGELLSGLNNLTVDILQAFIQSIVLAARYHKWLKVMNSSKHLWKAIQSLIRYRKLASDSWRQSLWRGMHVAACAMMDTLTSVTICHIDDKKFQTSQRASNPFVCTNTFQSAIPCTTLIDLQRGLYTCNWIDQYGELQTHYIDLAFFADFFLFTLETMNASGKFHRILEFGEKFQTLFNGIYSSIVNPILEKARLKTSSPTCTISANNSLSPLPSKLIKKGSSENMLFNARQLHSNYLYQKICSIKSGSVSLETFTDASNAYEKAISVSHKESNFEVFSAAANEHGDLLFEHGNISGACVFWSKSIDALFQKDKALSSWKTILGIDHAGNFSSWTHRNANQLLESINGKFNCLLAATAVTKIARFYYFNNQNKRSELVWFAAHLYIAPIVANLPRPTNYLEYANYTPSFLLLLTNVFADKFTSNPATMCDCLFFLIEQLFAANLYLLALPLAAIIDHISLNVIHSQLYCAKVALLKSEALVNLGMIFNGIGKFLSVIKHTSPLSSQSEESELMFSDNVYSLNAENGLALKLLMSVTISEKTKSLYPASFQTEIELCRLKLVIKILEMSPTDDCFYNDSFAHSLFDALNMGNDCVHPVSDCIKSDSSDLFKSSLNVLEGKSSSKNHNQPFLEPFTLEILDTLRIHLFRIIQQKQNVIKSKFTLCTVHKENNRTKNHFEYENLVGSIVTLVRCFELIGNTYFIQKQYRSSLKWYYSARNFVSSLADSTDLGKYKIHQLVMSELGSEFILQTRRMLIIALIADGKFQTAYDLCNEGIEEAAGCHSVHYQLLFSRLLLFTCQHMNNLSSSILSAHINATIGFINQVSRIPTSLLNYFLSARDIADLQWKSQYTDHHGDIGHIIVAFNESHSMLKNVLGEYHIFDATKLYDPFQQEYILSAYKAYASQLRANEMDDARLTECMREVIGMCFKRPLQLPVYINIQLAFDLGQTFANIRPRYRKNAFLSNLLLKNSEHLITYVLHELCNSGGYEYRTLRSCLLCLLSLNLESECSSPKALQLLYQSARVYRMKQSLEAKSVENCSIPAEECPSNIITELHERNSSSIPQNELFESYDPLYVEDSQVFERSIGKKYPALDVYSLIDYRCHLECCLAASRDRKIGTIRDEFENNLTCKLHSIHFLMNQKFSWYKKFCLESPSDWSIGDYQSSGTAVLSWIPVSFYEHINDKILNLVDHFSSVTGIRDSTPSGISLYKSVFYCNLASHQPICSKTALKPVNIKDSLKSNPLSNESDLPGEKYSDSPSQTPQLADQTKQSLPKIYSTIVPYSLLSKGEEFAKTTMMVFAQFEITGQAELREEAEFKWRILLDLLIVAFTGDVHFKKINSSYPSLTQAALLFTRSLFDPHQSVGCGLKETPQLRFSPNPYKAYLNGDCLSSKYQSLDCESLQKNNDDEMAVFSWIFRHLSISASNYDSSNQNDSVL